MRPSLPRCNSFFFQAWVNGATNRHFIKLQARLQAWLHDRGKKGVWFEDNLAGESTARRRRRRCCRRRRRPIVVVVVVVSVVSVVVVVVVLVLVLSPPPPASALCDAVHPVGQLVFLPSPGACVRVHSAQNSRVLERVGDVGGGNAFEMVPSSPHVGVASDRSAHRPPVQGASVRLLCVCCSVAGATYLGGGRGGTKRNAHCVGMLVLRSTHANPIVFAARYRDMTAALEKLLLEAKAAGTVSDSTPVVTLTPAQKRILITFSVGNVHARLASAQGFWKAFVGTGTWVRPHFAYNACAAQCVRCPRRRVFYPTRAIAGPCPGHAW